MRPFNLKEAKKGKPVITRDGQSVRIVCWDRKETDYPIIALIGDKEDISSFTTDGRYICGELGPKDLFMASEKKEGWTNIYKIKERRYPDGFYTSEGEAKKCINLSSEYVATIKVEWEE